MKLFAFDDSRYAKLVAEHGTPAFVYDAATAKKTYSELRSALPSRVQLAYAVKANPYPELLRLFALLGAGFDCASEGEIRRVANLGLPMQNVLFAGPGKRRAEIALALELGVRLNAESWEDLQQVNELSSQPVKVNLRVHPSFGSEEGNTIIGGSGPSAFGIDEEQLPELLEMLPQLGRVRVAGLHVFIASNQRSSTNLLATYKSVFGLAQDIRKRFGVEFDQIDLGGGLGVPYSPIESPLDTHELGRGLEKLLWDNSWFGGAIILEPGRYLASGCGVYLTRVIRTKQSRGERFVILEGGINQLLRPALTGQPFPVKAIDRHGEVKETVLAGPLCTSLDRLGTVSLPDLSPGDLLVFGMTGAYGFTEAMTNFLSHAPAKEVWIG